MKHGSSTSVKENPMLEILTSYGSNHKFIITPPCPPPPYFIYICTWSDDKFIAICESNKGTVKLLLYTYSSSTWSMNFVSLMSEDGFRKWRYTWSRSGIANSVKSTHRKNYGCIKIMFEYLLFDTIFFQDLRKAAILVFANKQDIKGSMSAAEISQHLNLTSIKDHPWHIQGCCALSGEG